MMNNWTNFVSCQSGYSEFADWKHWQKGDLCKLNGPWKVCRRIHQDSKIGTLKVFLEKIKNGTIHLISPIMYSEL